MTKKQQSEETIKGSNRIGACSFVLPRLAVLAVEDFNNALYQRVHGQLGNGHKVFGAVGLEEKDEAEGNMRNGRWCGDGWSQLPRVNVRDGARPSTIKPLETAVEPVDLRAVNWRV